MKRVLAVVLAMVVSVSAQAYSVGLVDIQKILSSDHGINKIQSNLAAKFSGERDKLSAMAKKLQEDGANFEKNRAVMSKADLAKKEDALKAEATQVQLTQSQFQQKFMQAQQDAMKVFVDSIKNAASKVATREKLDAVFIDSSLLFAKDAKDITASVLSEMK